jgi:hypothetical protein
MALRPFRPRGARGNRRLPLRRLLPGAVGLALLVLGLSGITANAATPPAGCIPINYTTCIANGVTYTSNPNAIYSNATVYTTTYAPSYAAYTAPAPASTGYPPNTVISTYFDPRYCGNGAVSVVTDSSGNLIDVCTSTGVRIYPVFPDYGYGYPYGYAGGYYGGCPVGNYSCLAARGIYYP